MITFEDFLLIEDYLSENLDSEQSVAFQKRMSADNAFAEQVFLQEQLVHAVAKQKKQQRFRDVFDSVQSAFHLSLEADALVQDLIQATVYPSPTNNEEGATTTYTLEELLDMFKPVGHYELAIAESMDGGLRRFDNLRVWEPINGINCTGGKLHFRLNRAVAQEDIIVRIENNREDTVLDEQLSGPASGEFEINVASLSPGRYYWKLKAGNQDAIIGMFFIHKDILPAA